MTKGDITRKKILDAAEEIFANKGLAGARVDEIAKMAGVNKRMIYAYFESKENLYGTVLKIVYSRLAELEKTIDSLASPEDAVRKFIQGYFKFLNDNPNFVSLVLWENLNKAEFIDLSEAVKIKHPAVEAIRAIVRIGKKYNVFKESASVDEIVMAVNMFCFSYFSNRYTMPKLLGVNLYDKESIESYCNMVSDMILLYLKA